MILQLLYARNNRFAFKVKSNKGKSTPTGDPAHAADAFPFRFTSSVANRITADFYSDFSNIETQESIQVDFNKLYPSNANSKTVTFYIAKPESVTGLETPALTGSSTAANSNITEIVSELSRFVNLKKLVLANTKSTLTDDAYGEFFKRIAGLYALEEIDIVNNSFGANASKGAAVAGFGLADVTNRAIIATLVNLIHFKAGRNKFSGMCPELFQLPKVKTLDLSLNPLAAALPAAMNMPELETLILQQAQVSGSIPAGIHLSTKLISINISFNTGINGAIPTFSADANPSPLTLLSVLNWSPCRFSPVGGIPGQWAGLARLKTVNLAGQNWTVQADVDNILTTFLTVVQNGCGSLATGKSFNVAGNAAPSQAVKDNIINGPGGLVANGWTVTTA